MSYLKDPVGTTITFETEDNVKFKEQTIQVPGVAGGGGINCTTLQNTAWRTQLPKILKTGKPINIRVTYDPLVLNQIYSLINENQEITITFNNTENNTIIFFGWVDDFTPAEVGDGDLPTAQVTIIVSNVNSGTGLEVGPVVA